MGRAVTEKLPIHRGRETWTGGSQGRDPEHHQGLERPPGQKDVLAAVFSNCVSGALLPLLSLHLQHHCWERPQGRTGSQFQGLLHRHRLELGQNLGLSL